MFDDGDDDEDFNPLTCCGLAHKGPRNCGPSLVMNILFISGRESREENVLKKIMYIFLHDWDWHKFLDKVGFGHKNGFDRGLLLLLEKAGFAFWFEPRPIDVIIAGLRRAGDVISVKFLEEWKQGPGGELGTSAQAVFALRYVLVEGMRLTNLRFHRS